jgi:protein tyrosine phosphatase (PTP) superfamily phosphohydrolase (DUF442 family)
MRLRRVATFLAAAVLVVAASAFAYLEYKGVHVWAIMTARQTPALPLELAAGQESPEGVRPATWAQPLSRPGLPNFYKISDDLYRGEQPTAAGFAELKKMGIKTVVNLRALHSDPGEKVDMGLDVEHIEVEPWNLDETDVVRFLRIVTDKSCTPVFVHCQHGSDRTGTMSAAYRIVVQGWSKDEAIREMTRGGFGYHEGWENLQTFLRQLDVGAIQKQLTPAPPPVTPDAPASNG